MFGSNIFLVNFPKEVRELENYANYNGIYILPLPNYYLISNYYGNYFSIYDPKDALRLYYNDLYSNIATIRKIFRKLFKKGIDKIALKKKEKELIKEFEKIKEFIEDIYKIFRKSIGNLDIELFPMDLPIPILVKENKKTGDIYYFIPKLFTKFTINELEKEFKNLVKKLEDNNEEETIKGLKSLINKINNALKFVDDKETNVKEHFVLWIVNPQKREFYYQYNSIDLDKEFIEISNLDEFNEKRNKISIKYDYKPININEETLFSIKKLLVDWERKDDKEYEEYLKYSLILSPSNILNTIKIEDLYFAKLNLTGNPNIDTKEILSYIVNNMFNIITILYPISPKYLNQKELIKKKNELIELLKEDEGFINQLINIYNNIKRNKNELEKDYIVSIFKEFLAENIFIEDKDKKLEYKHKNLKKIIQLYNEIIQLFPKFKISTIIDLKSKNINIETNYNKYKNLYEFKIIYPNGIFDFDKIKKLDLDIKLEFGKRIEIYSLEFAPEVRENLSRINVIFKPNKKYFSEISKVFLNIKTIDMLYEILHKNVKEQLKKHLVNIYRNIKNIQIKEDDDGFENYNIEDFSIANLLFGDEFLNELATYFTKHDINDAKEFPYIEFALLSLLNIVQTIPELSYSIFLVPYNFPMKSVLNPIKLNINNENNKNENKEEKLIDINNIGKFYSNLLNIIHFVEGKNIFNNKDIEIPQKYIEYLNNVIFNLIGENVDIFYQEHETLSEYQRFKPKQLNEILNTINISIPFLFIDVPFSQFKDVVKQEGENFFNLVINTFRQFFSDDTKTTKELRKLTTIQDDIYVPKKLFIKLFLIKNEINDLMNCS